MTTPRSALDSLRAELQKELDENHAEPKPLFSFRVGWSDGYDNLFQNQFLNPSGDEIESLLKRALEFGRVIVHAKGGSGKTVILWRLIREASQAGVLSFVIQLRNWTSKNYDEWERRTNQSDRIDYLFRECTVPPGSRMLLGALANVRKLICFDGLNEIESRTAQGMIEAADEIAARLPASGILITDRLVRRQLPSPETWSIAALLPIDEKQVRHLISRSKVEFNQTVLELLQTAYFLDAALKGDAGPSKAAIQEQWFRHHAGLSSEELALAAQAAFKLYLENRARTFPIEQLRALLRNDKLLNKLLETGAVIKIHESACFDHHLKHDFLAARYLAGDSSLWVEPVFNAMTFYASSFDALVMTIEMLRSHSEANEFVRHVYDWNYYGAAYVAAENCRSTNRLISREMEVILMAMLADKLWDIMRATAERARDGLELFGTDDSRRLLNARSYTDINVFIGEIDTQDTEFLNWKRIFLNAQRSSSNDIDITQLREADGLVGWTIANVLKRTDLEGSQVDWIRNELTSEEAVIRWRAAHVLGRFPNPENAEGLLAILDREPESWVAYGAIRSLIEMAALGDHPLRNRIFDSLISRAGVLAANRRLVAELERAIFVSKSLAPPDWRESVISLLKALRGQEKSLERWDHWEQIAYSLVNEYSESSP